MSPFCSVYRCNDVHYARGYCYYHYYRVWSGLPAVALRDQRTASTKRLPRKRNP